MLKYKCARIELARDEEGNLGVLNYIFSNKDKYPHTDINSVLNKEVNARNSFYTIPNIKKVLDDIDDSLFKDFIKVIYMNNGKSFHLGYVPMYYSRELTKELNKKIEYSAMIQSLNFESELSDEDIAASVKLIFND